MSDSDDAQPPEKKEQLGEKSAAEAELLARQMQAIDLVTALNRAAAAADAPAKFSLTELFLFITVLACGLGLARSWGAWGGLIALAGSCILSGCVYHYWYAADRRRQLTLFDTQWGLIMPMVCLTCDPFAFRDQGPSLGQPNFHELRAAHYFIYGQLSLLSVWLIGRPWLKQLAGLFLGIWLAGFTFTSILGVALIVPLALGVAAGVVLIAFTTIVASYVLLQRIRETIELADESLFSFPLLATIGFLAAVIAPVQVANWLQR